MKPIPKSDSAPEGIRAKLKELKQIKRQQGAEAAEKALIEVIKEYPEAGDAYVALARILLEQKKNDYALRASEKAVSLSGLDHRAHTMLGVARMRNDDLKGAEAAFAQALDLNKEYVHAMLGAASVKLVHENYDDALALCDQALEINPNLTRAHQLVARINIKQGKPEVAAKELRKLVEDDASNDRALRAYLRLMRKEGKLDSIAELAESNLATEPPTPRSIARYARMVMAAGKPDLAVEQYRKLIETDQARALDKLRFITALIAAGQFDEAREAIGGIEDRLVAVPLKLKLEGDIALAEGAPDKAIDLYRSACAKARVDGHFSGDPSAGKDKLAQEWQTHTARALRTAIKDARQQRKAAANE